ncbi:helix-turn-helix domain-containing protein [Shouchella clausii]|uniref:MerR family transcriptional regulator n=2 Tax=Bacteria TaxID=2 RepID=UPI0004E63DC6|nr:MULTISPECIES: helix-turn-helix domain-containing protein [Bacillaceae]ALA55239.1 hypothetical protein DB29_0P0027 [Shouchella clausii]MBU3266271.1 helix-turn-helix domain-containing protein [Shouchella clausii]MBU3509364.1 helix-turn-helix domain-containing protein [Shouchella clausii]MDP0462085.1 helix-turn-helix domain-containing protein [Shouchella rhizosphaerae]MDP5267728.1 helix-turn-helix domain-containing protein [Shouchella clausii]
MSRNEKLDHENIKEKQSDLSLTVKEAANHIGETPYVIRNWLRILKGHIPTTQGENGYHYFNEEAVERLLLIKQLSRDQGYSLKQIEYYLATGDDPLKPEKPPEDAILIELKAINEHIKLQKEFNQALVQKLEQQQHYIDTSLARRDNQLLESIRELQKARIETAAVKQEQGNSKKKSFIARLFSK